MKNLWWILAAAAVVLLLGVWKLLDEPEAEGSAATVGGPDIMPVSASTPAELPTAPTDGNERPMRPLAVEPVAAEVEAVEDERPAAYRAALGGLFGRVVFEDGEPVPDLPVALVGGGLETIPLSYDAFLQPDGLDFDPVLSEVRTDEEGRFRFTELPTRILGALLLDGGGPRSMLHMLERTPVSGEEHDLGDIVMPGSVTLLGRMVDEREQPLSGVRVRATDLPSIAVGSGIADFRSGGGFLVDASEASMGMITYRPPRSLARLEKLLPVPTTYSDEEGKFVLDGVRPGVVTLVADDGEHMTLAEGIGPSGAAGSTRDLGDVMMGDGVPLVGEVVDEKGKPVAGATVMAGNTMSMGPVTVLREPLVTDETGRFEFSGLSPRSAYAVARAPDTEAFTPSTEVTPGGPTVRIVVPSPRVLELTIVDGEGEPVDDVRVLGRMMPDDDVDEIPDFFIEPVDLGRLVSRNDEGTYIITGLDSGMWDLILKAPGFALWRDVYDLRPGDGFERIVLERGLQLPVRVVTHPDGEVVHHALVSAYAEDGGERPWSVTRTDSDGIARLSDLLPGSYRFEAEYPGLAVGRTEADLPLDEDEEMPTISIGRGGAISGTVVDGGQPPTELLMVTLEIEGDAPPSDQLPRMTLTAPDGSFRFENVPAGEVGVSARERVDLSNLMTWWEPFAMSPLAEADVFVTADAETEAVLVVGAADADVPTGTVNGRLIVNGKPGAGWKVRTWGRIRRSVTTGPDGRFNMGRLAAGQVVLMFTPVGGSQMMAMSAVDTYVLDLTEGATEYVDMAIQTGVVEGRVISELDGRPVEGAAVTLQAVTNERSGWWGGRRNVTVTDENGFFHFEPVAEGTYEAAAEVEGKARSRSEAFTVTRARTTDGVLVEVAEALEFSGRLQIEGLTGEPEWMWLTAREEGGNESAARPDPETLRFHFDDLTPGTWTFSLYGSFDQDYAEVEVFVNRSTDQATLVFVPEVEDPVDPAALLESAAGGK